MKHQSKQDIRTFNEMLKVADILGELNEGRVKEGIEIAQKHGYTAKQFGIISRYAGKTFDPSKRAEFYKGIVKAIEA